MSVRGNTTYHSGTNPAHHKIRKAKENNRSDRLVEEDGKYAALMTDTVLKVMEHIHANNRI